MRLKLLLVGLFISTTIQNFAQKANEALQAPAKIMESFEEGIPEGLSATGKPVSIAKNRMKHGYQSMKWEWKGNDQIIFNSPVGYHKQRIFKDYDLELNNGHGGSETNPILEPARGFFMWVYNEKPTKQRMRIQFGKDEDVDCEFDFNLNFKGWRSIAIGFDRGDMRGTPEEDMNRMTINAPATGSGTFYLDMLGMSVTMNSRTVGPNPQLPEIDQHPRLVAQYPHLLLEFSKYKPTFQLEEMTDDVLADFRKVEKQIKDIYWPEYNRSNYTDDDFDKIKKAYDSFEIVREGDRIYGRPLIYQHIMNDYFTELKLSKDEKYKGLKRWRHDFNYALRDISNLYYYSENAKLKEQLEEMFINLFDYGVDQGFDYGAGLGWIHHYSYNIKEYGPAMFIMRDVLKKHNRLEKAHEVCRWMYAFNQVYNENVVYNCEGRIAGNADEIQGLLMPKLITAFLQADAPEKARDLKHFTTYFSKVYTGYAQALDECFKPDGTVFHHAGHAFGYGGRAINGAVSTMYILSGTSFEASEEAYLRMRKVTKTYMHQMFTDAIKSPNAFSNIRFNTYKLPKQFYPIPAMLALAANQFDEEMAALYDDLRLKSKADRADYKFWKEKIDAARKTNQKYDYSACNIYPYTCVAANRNKDNYMITIRAHSKYVYPFESWGKSFFAYPLFIANGYLDVVYPKNLDSTSPENKIWHKGYDWHRWPGVTSVNLPYDKMLTDPGQVRDEGGEYLFSDQAFSGGVSTSYACGIYAFQFKGHDKFNLQGFTGKKTYFFVGDKVVCLGTDIKSDLDYEVETTLFQTHLKGEATATVIGEKGAISDFPYTEKHNKLKSAWMIDSRNTGFYISSIGQNSELVLKRSAQSNPDKNDKEEVSGNFATAYINHGKAPENASYNYILMADVNAAKMNALSKEMAGKHKPVQIIQQDSEAHIVRLNKEKATAYAVYAKQGAAFRNGLVAKVNKQATFMVKEEGKKLVLSVADPDLNIYDGQDDLLPDGSRCELSVYEREWFFWKSRSTKVQLTLNGKWTIEKQLKEMETAEEKKAKIVSDEKNKTVIEFECRDGLSAEVLLTKE